MAIGKERKRGEIQRVLDEVRRRETPTPEERRKLLKLAEELRREVASSAERGGLEAEVTLEGSVAKDTWLPRSKDIDIFLLLPPSFPKEALGRVCLEAAREGLSKYRTRERYADHPYLEAQIDENTLVNVVPCYNVPPNAKISATDRTPHHTHYVKQRLTSEASKGEVRLLKGFLKGVGAYGAEVRVGGFSGYLVELLTLQFGSFLGVLGKAARWEVGETIDPEGAYRGREEDLHNLFDEPLIVVDPVDPYRNVASAVRPETFDLFRLASKTFLKNPTLAYFYPPSPKPPTLPQLKKTLKARGTDLVIVKLGPIEAVPDVLWGQLYKTEKALSNLLVQNEFKLLGSRVWSDEVRHTVLVFELESARLPPAKRHQGPPLLSREAEAFLKKYTSSPSTLAGPWVAGGRWVATIRRRNTDAVALLRSKLEEGGRDVGVASRVAERLKEGFSVILNEEISPLYRDQNDLRFFLTKFLSGRPPWFE